jgi:hydroxymethylpyrimidine/phosphomethylpyrimidine kinase
MKADQPTTHRPPTTTVLTIAGSDSGGGAGIQADLGVFAHLGVHGATAITAITAQNEEAVRRVEAVEPSLVTAQIDAVVQGGRPKAIKSGMLANGQVVRAVAAAVRRHRLSPYVLDPVMIASSGAVLLEPDAFPALVDDLIPLADLVTPNLDEAARILGEPVSDVSGMERAARALVKKSGARAALVTGGHLSGSTVVDVLFDGVGLRRFSHRRIPTGRTHGTGCRLSAAIAAHLALGEELPFAVDRGIRYVRRELRAPGRAHPGGSHLKRGEVSRG